MVRGIIEKYVQLEMFLPEAEADLADGRRLGGFLDVTGCWACQHDARSS